MVAQIQNPETYINKDYRKILLEQVYPYKDEDKDREPGFLHVQFHSRFRHSILGIPWCFSASRTGD